MAEVEVQAATLQLERILSTLLTEMGGLEEAKVSIRSQ